MATPTEPPHWLQRLPELAALQDEGVRRLLAQAHAVDLPRGARVFHEGEGCRAYLLVLEGSVRVQKVSESGREIVLYRVESGEDCVLTTSCLLGREPYHAEAIAETDVRAVALPAPAFRRALAESEGFRNFIFRGHGRRISDLILLVEEVAFRRVDLRLARLLVRQAGGQGGVVELTHEQLGAELGTAREVISRQLKEFERRGWVRLGRGRVEVTDAAALEELARREGL